MKQKLPAITIALSVTTLILGILLINKHNTARKAVQLKSGRISQLNTKNETLASGKSEVEQKLVTEETKNKKLAGKLEIEKKQYTEITNQIVNVTKDLESANKELDELTQDYLAATNEVTQLNKELAEAGTTLGKAQKEIVDLTKNVTEATNALANVTKLAADRADEIASIAKELTDAEGEVKGLENQIKAKEAAIKAKEHALTAATADKEFLLAELDRLRDDKAKLEAQLNDVEVLKAQLQAIQKKITMAQRMDWVKRGVYDFHNNRGAKRLKLLAERRRMAASKGSVPGDPGKADEKAGEGKITSFELKSDGTIIINGKEYKPGETQPQPNEPTPKTPPSESIPPAGGAESKPTLITPRSGEAPGSTPTEPDKDAPGTTLAPALPGPTPPADGGGDAPSPKP